ncbi:unnamed protein product [Peniophora sp. CBMAI 1063]|nr:unnamed protein product [Peniophora sp. CBMAI 1063]
MDPAAFNSASALQGVCSEYGASAGTVIQNIAWRRAASQFDPANSDMTAPCYKGHSRKVYPKTGATPSASTSGPLSSTLTTMLFNIKLAVVALSAFVSIAGAVAEPAPATPTHQNICTGVACKGAD